MSDEAQRISDYIDRMHGAMQMAGERRCRCDPAHGPGFSKNALFSMTFRRWMCAGCFFRALDQKALPSTTETGLARKP